MQLCSLKHVYVCEGIQLTTTKIMSCVSIVVSICAVIVTRQSTTPLLASRQTLCGEGVAYNTMKF